MTRDLAQMTSPEAREAMAASRTVVLPIGSIEQHGPHLPNGTDTMAAELVAMEVAERLDAVYAPFCPYGVTPIHAGHPGTINLRRSTFEALLKDICTELVAAGAETLILVNWHEGNIASMNAVGTDIQERHDVTVVAAQACYTAQRLYREEGGELTHGGGIETLAILAYDASAGEGGPRRRAHPPAGRARDGRHAPLARGLRLHHRRHRARRRRLVRQPAVGHHRARRQLHRRRRGRRARGHRGRHERPPNPCGEQVNPSRSTTRRTHE